MITLNHTLKKSSFPDFKSDQFLITHFPVEVIHNIFNHLGVLDLYRMGLTCKRMQACLISHLNIFQKKLKTEYPHTFPQEVSSAFFLKIKDFTNYFKNKVKIPALLKITKPLSHLKKMYENKIYGIPLNRIDSQYAHLLVYNVLTQSFEPPLIVTDSDGYPIRWKHMNLGIRTELLNLFPNTHSGPDISLSRCSLAIDREILTFFWGIEISKCQWNLNTKRKLMNKVRIVVEKNETPNIEIKKTMRSYIAIDSTKQKLAPFYYEECICRRNFIRIFTQEAKLSTDGQYHLFLLFSKDPATPQVEAVILNQNGTIILRSNLQKTLPNFSQADHKRFICVYNDEVFVIECEQRQIKHFKLNFQYLSIVHPHAVAVLGDQCLFLACFVKTAPNNCDKEFVFVLDMEKGKWLPNPLEFQPYILDMTIFEGNLYILGLQYDSVMPLFPQKDYIYLSQMVNEFDNLSIVDFLIGSNEKRSKSQKSALTKKKKKLLESLIDMKDSLSESTRDRLGKELGNVEDFFSHTPTTIKHDQRSLALHNLIFDLINRPRTTLSNMTTSRNLPLQEEMVEQAVLWNLGMSIEARDRYQKLEPASKKLISNVCYELYHHNFDADATKLKLTKDNFADLFFQEPRLEFISNGQYSDMLISILKYDRFQPKKQELREMWKTQFKVSHPLDYLFALGWPSERLKGTNISFDSMNCCGIHTTDDLPKLTLEPKYILIMLNFMNEFNVTPSSELIDKFNDLQTRNETGLKIQKSLQQHTNFLKLNLQFAKRRLESLTTLVEECGHSKFFKKDSIENQYKNKIERHVEKFKQIFEVLEKASATFETIEQFVTNTETMNQINTEMQNSLIRMLELEITCQVGILDLYLGQVGSSSWNKLRKRSLNSLVDFSRVTQAKFYDFMNIEAFIEKIDQSSNHLKMQKL